MLDCYGEAMLQHPRADSPCSTGAEKQTLSCYCEEPRARSPCYRWQAPLRSDRVLRVTAGEPPASRRPTRASGETQAGSVPLDPYLFGIVRSPGAAQSTSTQETEIVRRKRSHLTRSEREHLSLQPG